MSARDPQRVTAGSPASPLVDVALNTVGATSRQLADAAEAAEAAGFAGVWCYDHLSGAVLGGARCVEVWSALTVVALATTSVTVGPLVLNASVRHPAHIATAAASLDEVSHGRLHLGLGAGAGPESPYSRELAMLGLPLLDAATRRARVRDATGYLRALWASAPSFRSEHYRFDAVEGVDHPHRPVPLIVAANGPRMARLAGAVADGLNLHDWQPDLERSIGLAREAAAARGGGTPFEVSIEGPLDPSWLDRSSDQRARLVALGASRLVLRWDASMGLAPLRDAAPHLITNA